MGIPAAGSEPLIFVAGGRSDGEAHRLIPQMKGQGAVGAVTVAIHQMGGDDLTQLGIVVIKAGCRRETVAAIGRDSERSHHLLAIRAHHVLGGAIDGMSLAIDGDRLHPGTIGPFVGGRQQIAADGGAPSFRVCASTVPMGMSSCTVTVTLTLGCDRHRDR